MLAYSYSPKRGGWLENLCLIGEALYPASCIRLRESSKVKRLEHSGQEKVGDCPGHPVERSAAVELDNERHHSAKDCKLRREGFKIASTRNTVQKKKKICQQAGTLSEETGESETPSGLAEESTVPFFIIFFRARSGYSGHRLRLLRLLLWSHFFLFLCARDSPTLGLRLYTFAS